MKRDPLVGKYCPANQAYCPLAGPRICGRWKRFHCKLSWEGHSIHEYLRSADVQTVNGDVSVKVAPFSEQGAVGEDGRDECKTESSSIPVIVAQPVDRGWKTLARILSLGVGSSGNVFLRWV